MRVRYSWVCFMKQGNLIKTTQEISVLREGGAILSRALAAVVSTVRPGATTAELDAIAERELRAAGGEPSFLGYKTRAADRPFPTTLCTSINHEVVHAPATPGRSLSSGDIIGLDIGVRYNEYCTDMAVTVGVGDVTKDAKRLMQVTRDALMRGVEQVRPGSKIIAIGRAVQEYVERNGFSVVRDLVGHGVGKNVHEEPRIPNYVDTKLPPVIIQEGMVLCIEPMVNVGDYRVAQLPDGWTIATADKSLAAHFEVTIIVMSDGCDIITPLPAISS